MIHTQKAIIIIQDIKKILLIRYKKKEFNKYDIEDDNNIDISIYFINYDPYPESINYYNRLKKKIAYWVSQRPLQKQYRKLR